MQNHRTLSDAEFLRQFSHCEMAPDDFTHEAHLRLAYLHLRQYGLEEAEVKVQEQLRRFVAHVGAADKYNGPLTVAAVRAVHQYMQRSSSDDFLDFLKESPALTNNFKEAISEYY